MKPIRVLWSSNGRGQGRSRRTERQQYLWLKGGTRRLGRAPGTVPTYCSPNIRTMCRMAPLTRCWHGAYRELEPVQPPMRYRHMSTFTVLWEKKYNKPEMRRVNGHWFMAQEPKGTSTSWRRLQLFPFPSLCPNTPYTELAQCWRYKHNYAEFISSSNTGYRCQS